MHQDVTYGIRLAILYGILWFIDLLDASMLNIALPEISRVFHVEPTNAEWVLIAFLLSMTLGMLLSTSLSLFFGIRRLFLGAQALYIVSSLACGFSLNIPMLVLFRIFQGLGAGLAIPVGMALLISVMPANKWAKSSSTMNLFTLLAPALGPIFAGYIVTHWGWPWLFFAKLPLSFIVFALSYVWVQKVPRKKAKPFDWLGFYFVAFSLSLLLFVFSEVGKPLIGTNLLIVLFVGALILGGAFIVHEKRVKHPLLPLSIFRYRHFAWGNLIQSAANLIFLGAPFLIALYLQKGLQFSIVETGWIMAAITLGLFSGLPFVARWYNRLGPLPFIMSGLLLMSFSMLALIWVTPKTSPYLIAFLIFCEGAGSSLVQTANVVSIFSGLPHKFKGTGTALYSLFKQISGSLGIALSMMLLSIGMALHHINILAEVPPLLTLPLFRMTFLVLGAIPLLALLACFFIDNKQALKQMEPTDHLQTETEFGAE